MAKKTKTKGPVWYESARRHAYQAWVGPDCAVAIMPDRGQWRWRVGRGELTEDPGPFDPVRGFVAKEGVVTSRAGAKRVALTAAKQACPVTLGRRNRRR